MGGNYVAFLRGINLGKRNIKMDDLRDLFLDLGFSNTQTVIASGNVLFTSPNTPATQDMERALADRFGFDIGVVLRSIIQLEKMLEQNLFEAYPNDKTLKFYLTMSSKPIGEALANVENVPGDFTIIQRDEFDFFTLAYRQPDGRFGAGMDKLERLFKDQVITTRNWNTILRIVKKINTTK